MIKIIDVSGTPMEMGLTIGREARVLVRKQLALYRKHWKMLTGVSWESGLEMNRPFEKEARQALPDVFDELCGIAVGAGVSARDLFLMNSLEEIEGLTDLKKKREHCTSITMLGAHMRDGRPRIGHNEDWVWFDTEFVLAVRARPANAPAFLSITYGGLLPNYGVNEHGFAQVCDSQVATDERVGVPRLFVARAVLQSKSVDAAMRTIGSFKRSGGYNHVLMDARGHAVNFETTATKAVALPVNGFSVHTNFYRDPKLEKIQLHTTTFSRYRYYRAKELLSLLAKKGTGLTNNDLFRVLADHQNYPESLCRHRSTLPEDNDQTIASYIIDVARKTIVIKPGNPCGRTTRKEVPVTISFLDEGQEIWQ